MTEIKEVKKYNARGEEYDNNGNLIYNKDSDGFEEWQEYDDKGQIIHHKDSEGFAFWKEYHDNGDVSYRDTDGVKNIIKAS